MSNFTFRHASNGVEIADGIDTIRVRTLADGAKEIAVHVDGEDFSPIYAELIEDTTDPVDPDPVDPDPVDPDPVDPGEYDVTPDTFSAALVEGANLLLAPGDYGELQDIPNGVTLTGSGAVFSGIDTSGTVDLYLDGIIVRVPFDSDQPNQKPIRFVNCTHITAHGCTFETVRPDGVIPTGRGPRFENCEDVAVDDCRFTGWHKNIAFVDCTGFAFLDNVVEDMTSDGLVISSNCSDGTIEGNLIGRRVALGGHGDMVVFQRSGSAKHTNISFKGNVIDMADGLAGQSLYFDGGNGSTYHEGIVIEGNIFFASHRNTIFGGFLQAPVIKSNTLIRLPRRADQPSQHGDGITEPRIHMSDVPGAILDKNVAYDYSGDTVQSLGDNLILRKEEYDAYFDRLEQGPNGWTEWEAKPGAFGDYGSPLI